MKTILVVDDEKRIVSGIEEVLNDYYKVIPAYSGNEAWQKIHNNKPDLIILDLKLPDMDGFELCRGIREDKDVCHIPIIMLTGVFEIPERIYGLEMGANRYITKPFDVDELLADVNAIFRTIELGKEPEEIMDIGGIYINRTGYIVRVYGRKVKLTPTEFKLLWLFILERSYLESEFKRIG